jgi:hypothetical protein
VVADEQIIKVLKVRSSDPIFSLSPLQGALNPR